MQNISLQDVSTPFQDHQCFQTFQIIKIFQTQPLNNTQKRSTLHKRNQVRHWNYKEKLKHALFLDYYGSSLNDKSQRKSLKIFKMMANFIKTRNQNQCRRHYHKTIATHGTNQKIIQYARRTYKNYEQEKIKMFSQFQKNQISSQKTETNTSEKNQGQLKNEKFPNCNQWELGSLKYINELRQRIEEENNLRHISNISAKNRNSENSEVDDKFNSLQSDNMHMMNQISQLQFYYSKWVQKMKELADLDPKIRQSIYHYLQYGV